MEMVTLYRPVGLIEAEFIMNDMFEGFPERLSWQPNFYPVLNIEYASEIASRWNVNDSNSGFVGIITKFEIPKIFFENFQIQQVGDNYHKELWVKSEDLPIFNDNIVKPIKFIKFFYGSEYEGLIPDH